MFVQLKLVHINGRAGLVQQAVTKIALCDFLLLRLKMGIHPFFLLLVATFVVFSDAKRAEPTTNTSYIIGTSDSLIHGNELVIDLHLLNLIGSKLEAKEAEGESCTLDLSVTSEGHLWHRSDWTIDVGAEPKSFHKTLRLLVWPDESRLVETSQLKIESHSCFAFSRSIEVPVINKDLLVSIRTDKPTYRPGEHVLIETLVLSSELRPHPRPVNLSIYNSRDEVMVRWLNITSEEGLIRERFPVPLLVRPEEWTITLEHHEQRVNHTLEIELPSSPQGIEVFEIDVRSPRYHTVHASDETKSPSLDISVVASLESGVPITGMVGLELSLVGQTTLNPMSPYMLATGHKLVSLKLEEVKKTLNMKPEESLIGRTVEIHVTVEKNRLRREEEKGDVGKDGPVEEPKGRNETTESKRNETLDIPRSSDARFPMHAIRKVLNVTFVDQSHVLFFSEHTPIYFKPGLSYIGQVLLKPIDGSLPSGKEEIEVTVNVKLYTKDSKTPKEEKQTLKLKPCSIGEFSVKVPRETTKMELEAVSEDKVSGKMITTRLEELLPFDSEDGHQIQVTMEQKPPVVHAGENIKVKVETTFSTGLFVYEIFCQSLLVLTGTATLPTPSTSHELSIEIPRNVSHLLSSPRLVVMALTPNLEIVSDSLRFVVRSEVETPIVLELKTKEITPGSEIDLLVRAEPSTGVYLLTLSEQLVFDSGEQEIRKTKAYENMVRYLHYINSTRFTETVEVLCETCSTIPSLAPDSMRVLNETFGVIFTDGWLNTNPSKPWPTPAIKNGTLDDLETLSALPLLEFEPKLWQLNVTVGPKGEETIDFVLPNEARLYTVAAFGLIPGKGLVVSEKPIQILVTSKIMADLRHPDYIIRGEDPYLELYLFNNQDKEVEVDVTQKVGEGYSLYCLKDESAKELSSKIKLQPKEVKVFPNPITSSPTGQEPLHLETLVKYEGIEIRLNTNIDIKYQGYEIHRPNSTVLDNFDGKQVHLIDIPKTISGQIEKSERAVVKIYGHPLGPAIERVCRELNESTIVEERMKMLFLIGVSVLEHISNNSLFDNSVEEDYYGNDHKWPINVSIRSPINREECRESIRDVLEHILEKRNPDGSVSFYSPETGYIWLTTLILDANIRLKNARIVDEEKLIEMIEWLLNRQSGDGSFVEDKNAIVLRNPSLVKTAVPLTSEVIATLLEVSEKLELPEGIRQKIKSATEMSIKFVLDKVMSGVVDRDAYSLNLAAYALALAKNEKIFDVIVKRNKLITFEDGLPHWWVELQDELIDEKNSLSIETTSYGILTYLALNDLDGASPFVEFITRQMKPHGSFVTTQDTNVALKALSQYYRQLDIYYEHKQVNVEVNVTLSGKTSATLRILDPFFVGELYFDNSNLTLGSPLKIESSGNGLILVQSSVKYNEASPPSKPTDFVLKLEERPLDSERFELNVCATNLNVDENTFFIGEVPILTGYEINVDKVKLTTDTQVYKKGEIIYIVFHKAVKTIPKCVDLELERLHTVERLEPRIVRLFPISDPDNSVYMPYVGLKLEHTMGSTMCPK